jgi:hypothetical protein
LFRRYQFGFLFLAIVVALFIGAKLRYPGRASLALPTAACDAPLWQHTYENNRLAVIEPCTAVEGRVASVHINEDGDAHIGLIPDDRGVLNMINATHMHSELVAEVVCDQAPARPPARTACEGFHSAITLPNIGDRVRITGVYVTDRDNGWNELHPISRIELLH